MERIIQLLKLMRIKHYLKNFLIFLPLIFSGNLFDQTKFINTLISFFIFSLTCSIVYIINDINDKNQDKLHSTKKYRPLANGKVTEKEALMLLLILSFITIVSIYYSPLSINSIIYLVIYIILNLLYTLVLKKIPIIDISLLSSLFVIRVLYGAATIDVIVSNWLTLTIISSSFYLVLSKRKKELESKKNTRKVLKHYNKEFLEKNIYMFLTMAIIFYSLWTIDLESVYKSSNYLIWTSPFIMIIAMKYNLTIEKTQEDNPIEIVLNDKTLISLILIYGIVLISILYFL